MSTVTRNKHKPNHKCLNCGKEYYRFPYEIKNGVKLCCSVKCRGEYEKVKYLEQHKPNTTCANCGKEFYRPIKKKKSKSGLYFCSELCQNEGYKKGVVKPGPKVKLINPTTGKPYTQKERLHKLYFTLGRKCKLCGEPIWNENQSGYCRKCCAKARYSNATQEQRHKWSEDAKKRMAEGKIKPWQSRNILSYPEKFFKKVLENNNIEFEGPNYIIKQKDLGVPDCLPSSCYFLDFKIGNVDLEIDGKQHSYSDRKESDKVRDEYLTKAGYIVYRIKWKSINSESGKQYIKKEIDKLLEFLGRVA
jgi:hypothetical protein